MVVKFPCKICNRPVAKNHQSIQCDTCDTWVHRESNRINKQTHKLLQNEINTKWFCIICTKEFLSFSNLNNEEFTHTVKDKKIKFTQVAEKQKSSKIKFFNKINTISENSGHGRMAEYWDPGETNEPEKSKNSLNFLHLNISSLPYHLTELQALLSSTKINFDINGISESRIKQNKNYIDNINLQNYKIEHCPTEAANRGVLLYIKDNIIYKLRKDLKIYKSKYLELTFLEVINQSGKNTIVGCICRHPYMDLSEFNNDYLNSLSEKLLREKNKHIILMGDFNVDLLKYTTDNSAAQFLIRCIYHLYFLK